MFYYIFILWLSQIYYNEGFYSYIVIHLRFLQHSCGRLWHRNHGNRFSRYKCTMQQQRFTWANIEFSPENQQRTPQTYAACFNTFWIGNALKVFTKLLSVFYTLSSIACCCCCFSACLSPTAGQPGATFQRFRITVPKPVSIKRVKFITISYEAFSG